MHKIYELRINQNHMETACLVWIMTRTKFILSVSPRHKYKLNPRSVSPLSTTEESVPSGVGQTRGEHIMAILSHCKIGEQRGHARVGGIDSMGERGSRISAYVPRRRIYE